MSYTLDIKLDCIKYTTVRDVQPGEELCIYYGHNLWFSVPKPLQQIDAVTEDDDGWGGLTAIVEDELRASHERTNPYVDGPQDEVISEEDLPFTRYKLPPEEEDAESIRTGKLCSHFLTIQC